MEELPEQDDLPICLHRWRIEPLIEQLIHTLPRADQQVSFTWPSDIHENIVSTRLLALQGYYSGHTCHRYDTVRCVMDGNANTFAYSVVVYHKLITQARVLCLIGCLVCMFVIGTADVRTYRVTSHWIYFFVFLLWMTIVVAVERWLHRDDQRLTMNWARDELVLTGSRHGHFCTRRQKCVVRLSSVRNVHLLQTLGTTPARFQMEVMYEADDEGGASFYKSLPLGEGFPITDKQSATAMLDICRLYLDDGKILNACRRLREHHG